MDTRDKAKREYKSFIKTYLVDRDDYMTHESASHLWIVEAFMNAKQTMIKSNEQGL